MFKSKQVSLLTLNLYHNHTNALQLYYFEFSDFNYFRVV